MNTRVLHSAAELTFREVKHKRPQATELVARIDVLLDDVESKVVGAAERPYADEQQEDRQRFRVQQNQHNQARQAHE